MVPLAIAAVVITVAAAAAQAAAQMQQAKAQAAQQRYNARLQQREYQQQAFGAENQALAFEQQAEQEREATAFDVAQRQEAAALAQAQDEATIAGSGVALSGSPLIAYLHNVRARELDTRLLAYEGMQREMGLESQAAQARFQAGELRQAGVLALQGGRATAQQTRTSGNWQAGATLVGGLAQGAQMGVTYGVGGA
jgi:hypothetical protein